MNVIIIGGGIGGPVAAMALQRAGIPATVYEAHDGPAGARGLFLGLAVNGLRVLRTLALADPVLRADAIATPRMVFSSGTGRHLGTVSNGWLDPRTPSITVMRSALQRALADEARRRGIEIRYGRRFVAYAEDGARVVAHFQDGSEARGDVLIGADGIHSRVRAVLAPDAPGPHYTRLVNVGGIAPDSGLPATPDTMHMVWGKRAFFGYTVRPGGEAWWFANLGMRRQPSREALAAVPAEEWRQDLRALFADDVAFIRTLIDRTEHIGGYPIHDMPPLPRWHRGAVGLLGDAAHAVSPSAGQGASLAFEDALMLAKCLRGGARPEAALARYEELRRRRAERIAIAGRRRGAYKALESRAAIWLRDHVMPVVFRFFATEKSMSWMHDYEIAWDEPGLRAV